jgi:hypothetical protein
MAARLNPNMAVPTHGTIQGIPYDFVSTDLLLNKGQTGDALLLCYTRTNKVQLGPLELVILKGRGEFGLIDTIISFCEPHNGPYRISQVSTSPRDTRNNGRGMDRLQSLESPPQIVPNKHPIKAGKFKRPIPTGLKLYGGAAK